jgi:hypothetical protein
VTGNQSIRLSAFRAAALGWWIGTAAGVLEALVTAATRFSPLIAGFKKSDDLEQLYDWRADPAELKDLAPQPELQPLVAAFRAELLSRIPGLQFGAANPK